MNALVNQLQARRTCHFTHGPYPDNWNEVKTSMEARGDIAVMTDVTLGGYARKLTIAQRPFNPAVLSSEETEAPHRQLERFAGFNASDIVAHSHRELGWKATEPREPIPYEASRFSAPVNDAQLSQEAQRIGDEESRRRTNL